MAQKRRGSGGSSGPRTPAIRGTLGTLIRSALAQAGGVREALERGAREGRSRIDSFRSTQKRTEALAELGEIVLELVRGGEIDLGELPEARAVIRHLDELDAGGEAAQEDVATPPSRSRFDTRATPRDPDDDGTTSSGRWSPPRPATPAARVWRPVAEAPPTETTPPSPARRVPLPKDPHRKGGISFGEDDEDLADYMHPDDVPAKPNSDD